MIVVGNKNIQSKLPYSKLTYLILHYHYAAISLADYTGKHNFQ